MNKDIEPIIDLFDEFYLITSDIKTAETLSNQPIEQGEITPPETTSQVEPTEVISTRVEASTPSSPSPISIQYAGANKKHIVFIYNDKINDSRENVEMITNLINKALNLSMESVAVIRMSKNEQLTKEALLEQLKPVIVVSFGMEEWLNQSDIHAQVHQPLQLGETMYFNAHSAHLYTNNNELKKAMWINLQPIFK